MVLYTAADTQYPSDIKPLTSMRFYAAMMIVVLHSSMLFKTGSLPLAHMFKAAYLGVDFFFVLSGFILTHVYKNALAQREVSYANFYMKRLSRIYPMHLFTLIIALLLQWYFFLYGIVPEWPHNFTYNEFFLHLSLLHAWGFSPYPSFNIPSWSISAEWFAYLLFPFLLGVFAKLPLSPGRLLAVSVILLLLFSAGTEIFFGMPLTKLGFSGGIWRIFPEFVFGMALYEWGCRYRLQYFSRTPFYLCIACALTVAYMQLSVILIVMLFGLMILMAAEQARQNTGGLLFHRDNVWLGEISYSIYMLHALIINFVMGLMDTYEAHAQWKHLVIFMIPLMCIALSALTHRYIELNGRRFMLAFLRNFGRTGKVS